MKKRFLTPIILSALAIASASILLNTHKEEVAVTYATQHKDNFNEYTYSGHYYDSITAEGEGLNGTLRQALTPYIHPNGWYTYSGTSGSDKLATVLQSADEDPTNSKNMIYLYTRDSVTKNAAKSWNREHVWPQSLSNNCWGQSYAGTDILHIRPTYDATNNKRGNYKYAEVAKTSPLIYQGMEYGYSSGGKFMPLDSVKGDVARIIMYVWVAYKEHYSNLPYITNVFESYDTLLKWHMEDKPDVSEGYRNDFSETSKQKNRNPFVDHPEYAWMIFGDSASPSVKEACKDVYPGKSTKVNSITIDQLPTKTEYIQYEDLDLSGIKVTAHYSDSSTKDVSNSVTSDVRRLINVGEQVITISYLSHTAKFTVNVTAVEPVKELEKIELQFNSFKTIYKLNEQISLNGLTVIAKYSDESESDVTSLVNIDLPVLDHVGEYEIVVSYTDGLTKSASFTITVKDNPTPTPPPTPTPDEPKKGCGGDVNATSIVLFTISGALILISLAIIIINKHKKVIKNK